MFRYLICGLLLLCLLAGCGSQQVPENKNQISQHMDQAFLDAYARRMQEGRDASLSAEQVLEHVQNMEALIAEARIRKLHDIPEFRQALHQFQAELFMHTLQPDLVKEIPRESISNEETMAFFEKHKEQHYSLPDLYTLRIAMSEDTEELYRLRELMDSQQPAENSSSLRLLSPRPLEQFPAPWQEALQGMKEGDTSPVLKHGNGFAVLRLESIETERFHDLEERMEYIRNDALYARYRNAWKKAYEDLREIHGIRMDSALSDAFAAGFAHSSGKAGENL
ncbi:parvulin-like peptidyl-prolyl cis-trans isomerase protein [Desulfobotulus alkaliphilus]|uniref:Parvulin-like peptidyl-prolyl cis-trans isomerase protein n=1 Tax=Desulfobotulus alkaliphilus TaxID=622671 RepID=A0A562S5Z8_9BACT|nr:peptidylprolyl isomerase [Desulfobotulus alkaliphilus]TWI76727.1 parvulin-like peptidyl-prolyl cis-trans isomerase protein [Desulfobotulus alkaliphilus]